MDLIQVVEGSLEISSSTLTEWPLPRLRRVGGNVSIVDCERLESLAFGVLEDVSHYVIRIAGCPLLEVVDLGSLGECSTLQLERLDALKRVSAPSLVDATHLDIRTCPRLREAAFPVLADVLDVCIEDSGDRLMCRVPELRYMHGDLRLEGASLGLFDGSMLESISEVLVRYTTLIEVRWPVLEAIYNGLTLEGCAGLEDLTLPQLTSIGWQGSPCSTISEAPQLLSIDMPVLTHVEKGLHIWETEALKRVHVPLLDASEMLSWSGPEDGPVASDVQDEVTQEPVASSTESSNTSIDDRSSAYAKRGPDGAPAGATVLWVVCLFFLWCLWLGYDGMCAGTRSRPAPPMPPEIDLSALTKDVNLAHLETIKVLSDKRLLTNHRIAARLASLRDGGVDCKGMQRRYRYRVLRGRVFNPERFSLAQPVCVAGDLVIHHTGVRDLRHLRGLVAIEGDLVIENNTTLRSLAGLEGVTLVGGHIRVVKNPVLRTLGGLGPIEMLGGRLVHDLPYASVPHLPELDDDEEAVLATPVVGLEGSYGAE